MALTGRLPSDNSKSTDANGEPPHNVDVPDFNAKTDYAINGGHGGIATGRGPAFFCLAAYPKWGSGAPSPGNLCFFVNNDATMAAFSGISADHTGAKVKQITDGLSKTILVGEKCLQPRFYETGYGDPPDYLKANDGDNNSMYQGFDWDVMRYASGNFSGSGEPQGSLPLQDTDCDGAGASPCNGPAAGNIKGIFGSAHSGAVNIAFCDGSVESISYDIDPLVWNDYGGRKDNYK
jgi:prepilin-type processing-associated H-X9-DG protein